jgi:rhamnosyltransferase subunit B
VSAKPELIFCTLGTRGDFQPFLLLASTLRSRGFPVTILSNGNWRLPSIANGLEFHAIADEDEPQSSRDDYRFFLRSTVPSFRRSFDFIEAKAKEGRKIMLLYRSNMLGAECASERFGIASGRIVLQPSSIKSCERPPWPLSIFTSGPLGWLGRRVMIPAVYAASTLTSRYRTHSNAFRRSVGLAPRSAWQQGERDAADFIMLLCPTWFAMPQRDWPANLYLTGFPLPAPAEADEAALQFVHARGAPIVFTPGTGVTDTAAFFDRAGAMLARAGHSGIFLSRHVPERYKGDPAILCRDYLDLSAILPHAMALVHHGGIGSAAEAMRAGIPQIVVPGRFDQPDNAMRIARLGLGAAILSDRHSGEDWAGLLERVLANRHISTQLSTAAALIASEDGRANVAQLVEHHVRRLGGTERLAA